MRRVVVLGGGIAGLSAAYRIGKLSPQTDITLVEAEARLGGKIVTARQDGFVVEGGPDTFLSYKPAGIRLCRELGLEERLHGTNQKIHRTYVMRRGRLYEMPEGLTGLIPSRFAPMVKSPLISLFGKARMGLELFVPTRLGDEDESLADFVRRRLGAEMYDRLIEPLMSGIYAGDGERLSLGATFPQLRRAELEHGSLVMSMLAAKREKARKRRQSGAGAPAAAPAAKSWPAFVTPETGLAEIVEALELALARNGILTGTRARTIARSGEDWVVELEDGRSLLADAVVVATPAHDAAGLLRGLDPVAAQALAAIEHASTVTLSVAYRAEDLPRPLDGYGYVIPSREGRAILACTWTSTKFPHRAPPGMALIRAFIGRAGNDAAVDYDDDRLLTMVRDELKSMLGITAQPLFHRTFRWPLAMPQYTEGHLGRVATIESRIAPLGGLALAGNAFRGIGLPDCIASGEAAAARVLAHIEGLSKENKA